MLFNSIDFSIFFPIVFIAYWLLNKNLKLQNFLIVFSSYIFYGWWDSKFLTLIFISTLIDFSIGIALLKENKQILRKILLWISIVFNLGLLGFFKYYNFFIENLATAFSFFGSEIKINTLSIILPVGISFYTFQTLSYSIDIYFRKLEPTKDFIAFSAFVSFFPQLVAGPIERATNLLPQMQRKRIFNYELAVDGLRQILWGLFKKVVIADQCALMANQTFENPAAYSGSTLVIGAVFFSFQIYGDFSGYSDIAIGTSKLLGFDLIQNFKFPYFSRDIAEFWRRWHISLSTWFRDYVYFSLGGSQGSRLKNVRNVFIIFIVSGFWHGANWTFIVWGLLNALYIAPFIILKNHRNNIEIVAKGKIIPQLKDVFNIGLTFSLTVFAWIFFRAENLNHAGQYISQIFSISLFTIPNIFSKKLVLLILFFMTVEWLGRESNYAIEKLGSNVSRFYKWIFYYLLVIAIIYYSGSDQQFIYFQF